MVLARVPGQEQATDKVCAFEKLYCKSVFRLYFRKEKTVLEVLDVVFEGSKPKKKILAICEVWTLQGR